MPAFKDPKTELILYTSTVKADGSNPVFLKVNYKGKRKYFGSGVYGYPKEWDAVKKQFKMCRPKCKDESCSRCRRNLMLRSFNSELNGVLSRMSKSYDEFNWSDFKRLLTGDYSEPEGSILSVFEIKIKELEKGVADKTAGVGTLDSYRTTRNNLKLFLEAKGYDKDCGFKQIDRKFLKEFENYLRSDNRKVHVWVGREHGKNKYAKRPAKKGLRSTSIGITMRNFRHVWHMGAERKFTIGLDYPFKTLKKGSPRDSAYRRLNEDDLNKLIRHQGNITDEDKLESLLLWMAMFYGCGMNMADLCRLEWGKHVTETDSGYKVMFQRTKNQNKDEQPIGIIEDPNLNAIIDWFKPTEKATSPYVFPVLNYAYLAKRGTLSEVQVKNAYRARNKKIVKHMRELCTEIGIKDPHEVDCYTARHSFAVLEYELTKDIYRVQTKLLHTSVSTTEKYLRSLGVKIKQEPNKVGESVPFVIMQKVS